jgi:hypothetical protein
VCDHWRRDVITCGDCQQLTSKPVGSWAIVVIGVMGNDGKMGNEGAGGSGVVVQLVVHEVSSGISYPVLTKTNYSDCEEKRMPSTSTLHS